MVERSSVTVVVVVLLVTTLSGLLGGLAVKQIIRAVSVEQSNRMNDSKMQCFSVRVPLCSHLNPCAKLRMTLNGFGQSTLSWW